MESFQPGLPDSYGRGRITATMARGLSMVRPALGQRAEREQSTTMWATAEIIRSREELSEQMPRSRPPGLDGEALRLRLSTACR